MRLKVILAVLITVPFLLTCESNVSDSEERTAEMMKMKRPNIIFMVGDGMGLAQMSSAFLYKKETPQ